MLLPLRVSKKLRFCVFSNVQQNSLDADSAASLEFRQMDLHEAKKFGLIDRVVLVLDDEQQKILSLPCELCCRCGITDRCSHRPCMDGTDFDALIVLPLRTTALDRTSHADFPVIGPLSATASSSSAASTSRRTGACVLKRFYRIEREQKREGGGGGNAIPFSWSVGALQISCIRQEHIMDSRYEEQRRAGGGVLRLFLWITVPPQFARGAAGRASISFFLLLGRCYSSSLPVSGLRY